jgi:glucosamine-phosphate N-acetyltransferase
MSNFTIREIEERDLQRGFFETLANLTEVGNISNDTTSSNNILQRIKSNSLHKIFVAVNDEGEVIGSITLLIEQKFIHDGGRVGHIEDVVTKKGYEGLGIASALIERTLEFARTNRCYKVILDCSEKNIAFYEKHGFRKHSINMRHDIK